MGVDQDHQVVRESRVFDIGVLAVTRDLFRALQHLINLREVDVAEQRRSDPALRNALLSVGFEHDYFTFDPLLAQNLLAPRAWARLNVHVMMKLRSKYAVTLYEILEAYANRENKTCIASMDEVRAWLKVSEDASSYGEWKDFRRRVIEPAVSEINKHADDAGFTVAYEGVREGKSYTKIRFTVTKTGDRHQQESQIKAAVQAKTRRLNAEKGIGDPDRPPLPSGVALEKFRADWARERPLRDHRPLAGQMAGFWLRNPEKPGRGFPEIRGRLLQGAQREGQASRRVIGAKERVQYLPCFIGLYVHM